MKAITTISAMILLFMTGCVGNKQSKEGFITVDVTKSYPEKKFILQDLFDIEYLPLETTDDFVTIGSLQAINEDFLLMTDGGRSKTGNIYIVNSKNGKYLQTINHLGQGAEEYVYLRQVVFDYENQELYVNDSVSRKILVYDLQGNFKRSLKTGQDNFYQWTVNFDRNHLICYCEPVADPGDNSYEEAVRNRGFMLVSKLDGSAQKIPVPYKKLQPTTIIVENSKSPTGKFYYGIQNSPLIPYQGNWLLAEVSADTIYQYSQDHTKKPFIVRTPSIQSMTTGVYLFPGVLTDRYCFLQTVNMEFDVEKGEGFVTTELVYDRKENSIHRYIIYNDHFTDEREINMVLKFPVPPFILNNNGIAFIIRLDTHDLMDAYDRGKLKGELKEIAAKLNEDSNPVIMIAKYKK